MKNTGKLSLTARGDREIVMTRVFDAPRTRVAEGRTWEVPNFTTLMADERVRAYLVGSVGARADGSTVWFMPRPSPAQAWFLLICLGSLLGALLGVWLLKLLVETAARHLRR